VVVSFSYSMGVSMSREAVSAAPVVEDLEVLEQGVGELDAGSPAAAVEELGLDPAPEGFDDGVVVAVADRAHGWDQPGLLGPAGERPGCELQAVVGVDHGPGGWVGAAVGDGHAERVGGQGRGLGGVDGPAHDSTGVHVEHDRAVELALPGGVLGDVGDPQLVRFMPGEVAVDEVGGESGVMHVPAALAAG
jgi:hypothetical protein